MVDVAVGVKVFMRVAKLRNLLESIERTDLERVYVADGGKSTPEKERLYARDFSFDLRVVDLPYDAGLGRGRKEIVDRLDEETYLLVVDSDNEVPENVSILVDQLESRSDVGGIAGNLVEPESGRLFQSAKDLAEEGDVLVRSADLREKTVETVGGHPFVEFDYIPNVTMFRTACLRDYCWDPHYRIGKEHVDFYVGHWKETDWTFGVCPEVLFDHYPGGDATYESHRNSDEKQSQSDEYFREKWGYEAVRTDQSYWFDTEHRERNSLLQRTVRLYRRDGIGAVVKKSLTDGPRVLRNVLVHR